MKKIEELRVWIKNHKKEILLVSGTVIVVGGGAMIVHNRAVANYKDVISIQGNIIDEQTVAIERMVNQQEKILAMKEAKYLELASDALRHGSPQGGMILADHRAALRAS